MSNRACVIRTDFVSYDGTTKGVRIYDDYGCYYTNNFEDVPADDMELFKELLKIELSSQNDDSVLSFVVEQQMGVEIDGVWYDWEQLKPHTTDW